MRCQPRRLAGKGDGTQAYCKVSAQNDVGSIENPPQGNFSNRCLMLVCGQAAAVLEGVSRAVLPALLRGIGLRSDALNGVLDDIPLEEGHASLSVLQAISFHAQGILLLCRNPCPLQHSPSLLPERTCLSSVLWAAIFIVTDFLHVLLCRQRRTRAHQ